MGLIDNDKEEFKENNQRHSTKEELNFQDYKQEFVIDFDGDRILCDGLRNEDVKLSFPTDLAEFLSRVNPMDIADLIAVLELHSDANEQDVRDIAISFRYRFDCGTHVNIALEGQLHQDISRQLKGKILVNSISSTKVSALPAEEKLSDIVSYKEPRNYLLNKIGEIVTDNDQLPVIVPKKGFLLLAGIDRFSLYNQAYGAAFVDEMIVDLEQQMKQKLSGFNLDMVHFAGDQYAFLFEGYDVHEMDHIARDVLQSINDIVISTARGGMRINFSMGGVSFKEKAKNASDFIAMAETALSIAKEMGRGRFTSYASDKTASAVETRKLLKSASSFLDAYEEGRFKLAFQPVINSKNGEVSFYECLLRILDENEKIIPAGAFIEKIEEFGLVHIADQFALHQAVEELEKFPDISLSVNVSNSSINNPMWLRTAINLLKFKPEIAQRLVIEITESTVMKDVKQSSRVMKSLKDIGCKIALDDFGTGYTSFHQIKEIQPDILKIDGYFAESLHLAENQVFLDAIQMLADVLNMQTVAEGAETALDVDNLKLRGVQNIQGYAYGHPSINRLWLPSKFAEKKVH